MRNFAFILFLISFLYPQVHKAIHDFSHRHDTICHAETEKHFHEHEHSCPVCDYKLPVTEPSRFFITENFCITIDTGSFNQPELFLPGNDDHPSSPRAPPCAVFLSA